MQKRSGKLIRVLAVAALAAMLVSALPASMATAARDSGCRVYNVDKEIGRNTLQRAVWDADPGDYLLVKGTCVGTTIVRKDLQIGWIETSTQTFGGGKASGSGKPRIKSGSWRPALVIHPKVDDFTIDGGLSIIGGIVIGDARKWTGKKVSAAWKDASPSIISTLPSPKLRYCRVRNDMTDGQFKRSQPAVQMASAGDHLSLRGTCGGATWITDDLSISGWRVASSAKTFGSRKVYRKDSGPPTLKAVIVDDDVDSFVLKRVRVTDGFRIADLAP